MFIEFLLKCLIYLFQKSAHDINKIKFSTWKKVNIEICWEQIENWFYLQFSILKKQIFYM